MPGKDEAAKAPKKSVAATEYEKKKQTFIVRAIWTFVMIAGMLGIMLAGHVPIILLVLVLEIAAYREVITMITTNKGPQRIPYGRAISWYFLITTIFYLEGDALFKFFHNVGIADRLINVMAGYHRILSYNLYITGFIFFVCTLRLGHYREQYSQLCAAHMALLLVVVQGHFVAENVLFGLFWFFVPAVLVIVNDIAAYLCGITMGHTPLIKISPKKTVEGFVGAWICTIIAGLVLTKVGSNWDYMTCPMEALGVTAFSDYTCARQPVFVPREWQIPGIARLILQRDTVVFAPVYIHVMGLATFASLVAPFGGFFASGLKRAFKVKDFGDTIPGHGGVTDRFDCQFVMGFFSYLYYSTFVLQGGVPSDYASVLHAVTRLPQLEQAQLLEALAKLSRPAL